MSGLPELKPVFDAAFDALEAGDLDEFDRRARPLVHTGCEFHSGLGSVVGGRTYRGPGGVRDWFGDLIDMCIRIDSFTSHQEARESAEALLA